MKNNLLTIVLIIALAGIFILAGFFIFGDNKSDKLVSSVTNSITKTPTPTPTPTPPPIIYNFDESTDLKKELETINPKVLDSDFDSLKETTKNL